MARAAIHDFLRQSAFWLMDISTVSTLGVSLFTPSAGFSSVTSPEINIELQEITEGNKLFRRQVVHRANWSPITLQRGATYWDADFYQWILHALQGCAPEDAKVPPPYTLPSGGSTASQVQAGIAAGLQFANQTLQTVLNKVGYRGSMSPRREFLLIHFFTHNPYFSADAAASLGSQIATQLINGASPGAIAGTAAQGFFGAVEGLGGYFGYAPGPGPFEAVARFPARAFLLHGCVPTRYKTGSDFDATSGAISLMELEMAVEHVEQINL